MVYSKPMTMTIPPSGGSPERRVSASTGDQGDENGLQILHRRIFLEALNFMDRINPADPFELYFAQRAGSNIIRRAVDVLVKATSIPDRLSQDPTYLEVIERKKREEEVLNYIKSHSSDINFSHGFRLMKEFMKGLKPYLDGSGAESKIDPGNINGLMLIGSIKLPVIEVIRHRANDSRGYTLAQLALEKLQENSVPGVFADDRKIEGAKLYIGIFLQVLVESVQAGEDYPILKRLAKLHPG